MESRRYFVVARLVLAGTNHAGQRLEAGLASNCFPNERGSYPRSSGAILGSSMQLDAQ
jgi:hypothetical protein